MSDDIKPIPVSLRWPLFLVVVSVALAIINGGIFIWRMRSAAPVTTSPVTKSVEPPAKDEVPSVPPDPKWGESLPHKKLVPGKEEK
jgi:hypothetical protein